MRYPSPQSRIGKKGTLVIPPSGERMRFEVVDEIRRFQSGLSSKTIALEKIQFEDGRIELRLGYYIIGKKPKMLGRWVWGQYATLLPVEDFAAVVGEARRRGWF